MNVSQSGKAARFRLLHQGPRAFIIPNPWDIGSARVLAGLGFSALATSSAASAAAVGRRDGQLSREETLAHARELVNATDLPVSADLLNGFGDSPATVAETVQMAAEAGLVGCTIEDATGNRARPLHEFELAVDRIAAAAEQANSLPFPFLLTARAHHLLYEPGSLDETIRRLQAFERAGAAVLFAPGLPSLDAVRTVCSAVSAPVNFMAGIAGSSFPVRDLEAAGVKRISLATSLYRAAMTGLLTAAREIRERGEFSFIDGALTTAQIHEFMGI